MFELGFFWMLNCMSSLYSLDISPLSDRSFANISPTQKVAFHSVDSFLCCAEAFQNDVVIVVFVAFGMRFKKLSPTQGPIFNILYQSIMGGNLKKYNCTLENKTIL